MPDLKSTLEKYLLTIKATMPIEQYERTAEIVKNFGKDDGEGPSLQQALKDFADSTDNWVSKMLWTRKEN